MARERAFCTGDKLPTIGQTGEHISVRKLLKLEFVGNQGALDSCHGFRRIGEHLKLAKSFFLAGPVVALLCQFQCSGEANQGAHNQAEKQTQTDRKHA